MRPGQIARLRREVLLSDNVAGSDGVTGPDARGAPGPGTEAAARQRQIIGTVVGVLYLLTIVLANYAITHWGKAPPAPGAPYSVPVWPGIDAPSGVLFAGLALTFRDLTQEWLGRRAVAIAIVVGALLSYLVTSNRDVAVASGVAFLFSEFADFAVYTPLRERRKTLAGWLTAVAASNVVGLIVDSILFLQLAFGSLDFLNGQIIGKLWMTILGVLLLLALRRWVIPRFSRPADEPTVPEVA
jgi:queuosine precursor transporter